MQDLIERVTAGQAEPLSAILSQWHEIESTHIILPRAADARVRRPDALSLFTREALGGDAVAAAMEAACGVKAT